MQLITKKVQKLLTKLSEWVVPPLTREETIDVFQASGRAKTKRFLTPAYESKNDECLECHSCHRILNIQRFPPYGKTRLNLPKFAFYCAECTAIRVKTKFTGIADWWCASYTDGVRKCPFTGDTEDLRPLFYTTDDTLPALYVNRLYYKVFEEYFQCHPTACSKKILTTSLYHLPQEEMLGHRQNSLWCSYLGEGIETRWFMTWCFKHQKPGTQKPPEYYELLEYLYFNIFSQAETNRITVLWLFPTKEHMDRIKQGELEYVKNGMHD